VRLDVRQATSEDEVMLLARSKEMIAESPRFKVADFNNKKATAEALSVIEHGGWFIAEEDGEFVGMICGDVKAEWFGDDLMGYDLFVYVVPEHRGGLGLWLLVQEFEKWCWSRGAKSIDLGVITEIHPEKTIKAYAKLGYELKAYACNKLRPEGE
jgi:GNAT superfamily N-acetyltransferase